MGSHKAKVGHLPVPVLLVTGANSEGISLSWSLPRAYPYVSAYTVERGTDGTTFPTTVYTGSGLSTTNSFSVQSGVTYYYRVRFVDTLGKYSAYSTKVSKTQYAPVFTQAPTSATIQSTLGGTIQFTATDQDNQALTYQILPTIPTGYSMPNPATGLVNVAPGSQSASFTVRVTDTSGFTATTLPCAVTVQAATSTASIVWEDALGSTPSYLPAFHGSGGEKDYGGVFSQILPGSGGVPPYPQNLGPTSTYGGTVTANGWHANIVTSPRLPNRGGAMRFRLDNASVAPGVYPPSGPPYDGTLQYDPAGGSTVRRRTEVRNLAYINRVRGTGGAILQHRTEHWLALSYFIPATFGTRPAGDGIGTHACQLKNRSDDVPWFHIGLDGNGWRIYALWNGDAVATGFPVWQQQYRYTTPMYGGYATGNLSDDFPNYANSMTWLGQLNLGGWTHWAVNFKVDRRPAADGGTGFLRIYNRRCDANNTPIDADWRQILNAIPRSVTVGTNTHSRGIGAEMSSDYSGAVSTWGGDYFRAGFYAGPNLDFVLNGTTTLEMYVGRALICQAPTDLAGIWQALNT